MQDVVEVNFVDVKVFYNVNVMRKFVYIMTTGKNFHKKNLVLCLEIRRNGGLEEVVIMPNEGNKGLKCSSNS